MFRGSPNTGFLRLKSTFLLYFSEFKRYQNVTNFGKIMIITIYNYKTNPVFMSIGNTFLIFSPTY